MMDRLHTNSRLSRIVGHGAIVYLCGQVGSDADVAAQTRGCPAPVEALLSVAGSSRAQIQQAVIWLADLADHDAMNAVWDDWVPPGHAPARAGGEARPADDDLKVEIIVTAAEVAAKTGYRT